MNMIWMTSKKMKKVKNLMIVLVNRQKAREKKITELLLRIIMNIQLQEII